MKRVFIIFVSLFGGQSFKNLTTNDDKYETFCIYSIVWFSAPNLEKWCLVTYVHLSIMLNIWHMKKCIKELKFFREFPKYRAFYCFFQQRDFV